MTIENTYPGSITSVLNNYKSKIYIRFTGNTALTILGFTGNDIYPIIENSFSFINKISDLP